MSAPQTFFKIRTPYKKCRHCGHRVPNPHDTVCPECHVPATVADHAMIKTVKWLTAILILLCLILLMPNVHRFVLEIADRLGRH